MADDHQVGAFAQGGQVVGVAAKFVAPLLTDKVRYAAISFGGWMGIGEKLFAVPWGIFKMDLPEGDEREKVLVLDMSKEELRKAPAFPRDNWNDLADGAYWRDVDAFYQKEPQDKDEQ